MNEKRRGAAKDEWKKKKFTPKDLRAKRSKAARGGLTKSQAALKTTRAAKRAANFPARKFAVTA